MFGDGEKKKEGLMPLLDAPVRCSLSQTQGRNFKRGAKPPLPSLPPPLVKEGDRGGGFP
jgi:hypothetical protein